MAHIERGDFLSTAGIKQINTIVSKYHPKNSTTFLIEVNFILTSVRQIQLYFNPLYFIITRAFLMFSGGVEKDIGVKLFIDFLFTFFSLQFQGSFPFKWTYFDIFFDGVFFTHNFRFHFQFWFLVHYISQILSVFVASLTA